MSMVIIITLSRQNGEYFKKEQKFDEERILSYCIHPVSKNEFHTPSKKQYGNEVNLREENHPYKAVSLVFCKTFRIICSNSDRPLVVQSGPSSSIFFRSPTLTAYNYRFIGLAAF